jgi:hypothetical protein
MTDEDSHLQVREEARRQLQDDISASMEGHRVLTEHSERLVLSLQAQAASLQTLRQQQQDETLTRWACGTLFHIAGTVPGVCVVHAADARSGWAERTCKSG